MNSSFFDFVDTYREDIIAFFKALIDFFAAIFEKLGGSEE